ncbi:hypothetical protein BHM03_00029201, partial [Ensete ventricosum]
MLTSFNNIYSCYVTGNVGDNNAIADVVTSWARPSRSTKDILLVPITVHLDHGNSKAEVLEALELVGPIDEFTSKTLCSIHLEHRVLAHAKEMLVEAELGRLSGTEDDLTVEDYEARLTDVKQ